MHSNPADDAPIETLGDGTIQPDPVADGRGRDMVDRLFRQLERQIGEIEDRMTTGGTEATAAEFERQARTLASMVRVLDRLVELKRASAPQPIGAGQERDAERVRQEIAQRLDRLRADPAGRDPAWPAGRG